MRTLLTLALTLLVGLATAGPAWAFTCPLLVKAANEAIAQAEPKAMKVTDERQKARDMALVEEAKALSKEAEAIHGGGGSHVRAEAKAKAAKWLAEQVK